MPDGPNSHKIVIHAYKEQRMEETDNVGTFKLPVNPEQWAQKFVVNYDTEVAPGGGGVEERFLGSGPEDLKLDFTFDGTDTIYGYVHLGKSVPDQIQEFKSVVYDLSGDIHRPRFLKILGMGINFPCVLSDLQITYTLFKADGTPLRAKMSATFLNFKEVRRRVIVEAKSSPDLTHVRMVEEGDALPYMTFRIYNDSKYYLEVAKANDLTNFRRLPAGLDITFPPLSK